MEQTVEGFADSFRELYGLEKPDLKTYSPLALAYLGDAVYELVVRTYVCERANAPADKLNSHGREMVNAHTQSEIAGIIADELSEEETEAYKRGRNARSYTKAKNASTADYRRATGLEALIGYLYLQGRYDRISELIHMGLSALDKLW